ncbi:MAG: phosphoribosylaminoimidazolesuccinocarboxamide synthase [Deltaproteobacteria bacterium]|nr:phosphoribosylaminoimidazolesuccinocarboxamide synthase [Deltaproteobacteria bacterium]
MEKRSLIREGKAKILFETNQKDFIIQYFKDDATAFNAQKKGSIKNKGAINNAISSWIFQTLGKSGISTHFVEKLSEREMLVRRVQIIPVETVIRNKAAGSIVKRFNLKKGEPLSPELIEYFYKSDELGDPLICLNHIFHFNWASPEEIGEMVKISLQVNGLLRKVFEAVGLDLVDFKLEFGKDAQGNVILADEFTPDGSRLWDLKTGESMDKDRFRQDLGRVDETYEEVYERLRKFFEGKV